MKPMKLTPLNQQRGASLIVVMLILIVVSILGVGGAQIALMSERGARNERDYELATQSALAAMLDAEFDMRGPGTAPRNEIIKTENNFDCSSSGINKGLCKEPAQGGTGKPIWLTIDLSSTEKTTEFGEQTGRKLPVGTMGVQPYKKPNYIIEWVNGAACTEALANLEITSSSATGSPPCADAPIYRVTAMGFGPRAEVQSVVQMVFRKD